MPQKKEKRDYILALILLLLSIVFWGYSFVSTKVVLEVLPPSTIAFLRQIIAVLTLAGYQLATHSFERLSFRAVLKIGFASFFGIVLYFILENSGLRLTSASNASMIVAAVPVFTLFSEALFFRMKITFRITASILLSLVGVYLVISVGGRLDFSNALWGNLLVLGAMLSWVIYTILNKKLGGSYSSMTLTTYQALTSAVLFVPFVIHEHPHWSGVLSLIPLLNLLYLGVFCSAFAYFFFIFASKRLGPTISSTFLNLIPVITVISGYLVLGERITWLQLGGMFLIILSLLWISYWPGKRTALSD